MTKVISFYAAPRRWQDDERYVYIGRNRKGEVSLILGESGYFGNPFKLTREEDRGATLDRFRAYAEDRIGKDPEYRNAVRDLAGKTLVCYCAGRKVLTASEPHVCHGQILAEIADALTSKEDRTDD